MPKSPHHKEKKIMEYEDSPSGFVTLYNYKEPFMKYEKGYGFQGVLLFDGETDKVQCHFCGSWFIQLGNHLAKEHGMRAKAYKEEVGLAKTTALIGENLRAKLIANGMVTRIKNLKNRTGIKHTDESKAQIAATLRENRMEMKNTHGTCPEQLIDRLIKEYQKLGRTPSIKTLSFKDALKQTYGTYKVACQVAGIPYNDPLEALKRGHQTMSQQKNERKEKIIEWVYNFYDKNNRLPLKGDYEDIKDYKFISFHYGLDEIYKEIVVRHGRYTENKNKFRFSKEELLSFLRNFESFHGRKPSYSDSRRRLIPHLSRYSYHFGSWKAALSQAFKS